MSSIQSAVWYALAAASYQSAYLTTANSANELTLTTAISGSAPLTFLFTTSPASSSEYNICTNLPAGKYCMDQWGNNATQPVLQAAGYYSGQQWTLAPTTLNGDTVYWMTSDFAGPQNFLSVVGNSVAMVSNAAVGNTYWKLVTLSNGVPNNQAPASVSTTILVSTVTPDPVTTSIPPSTSTAISTLVTTVVTTSIPSASISNLVMTVDATSSPSSSTTASTRSTNSSSTPLSTPITQQQQQQQQSPSPLSTGAKAGIAIGAIALALIVLIAALLFLRHRRRKPTRNIELSMHAEPSMAQYLPPPNYAEVGTGAPTHQSGMNLVRKPVAAPAMTELHASSMGTRYEMYDQTGGRHEVP